MEKHVNKRTPQFIILIVSVIITLCLCLCLVWSIFPRRSSGTTTVRRTIAPTTYNVVYEVTGTSAGGSMTYFTDQGGTEQGDYGFPFRKNYTMSFGDFAYISVQNNYDLGSVTCKIFVNGVEWKSSTSSGSYVIATCSGSVGRD